MIAPMLYAKSVNDRPETIGGETGYPDASNSFNKNTFVVLTTGALVAVASAGVLACGLTPDASKSSDAINPPDSFFGDRHYPFALRNQRFYVSVTNTAGNVGQANGAPQMSAVTIGESYGIIKLSNGNHALNVQNTTNDFFVVIEKPEYVVIAGINVKQDANTYNPIVVVEVVQAAQQNL